MKKLFFTNKKKTNFFIGGLLALILFQGVLIAKLYSEKDDKSYQVNLVKINTEKDSLDFLELKNDLSLIDRSVQNINGFLKSKNVSNLNIENLSQDSIANSVYLSKQSNRYSQYLVDLEKKLQQVPLGVPVSGYISSNFGMRTNPIPKRIAIASVLPIKQETKYIEEKDSAGNIIKKEVPAENVKNAQNNPPAEADQKQFHKGIDIASPYGSDVRCAAEGTVIFAGAKGGYGNCVIVQHGNGLATLYGHLSQILVKANQVVKVNDVIAKSGNSGRSTGPHLHYEVHKNNVPVNPKLFLTF